MNSIILKYRFSHELSEESQWLIRHSEGSKLRKLIEVLKMSPFYLGGSEESLEGGIVFSEWRECGEELELVIHKWVS